MSRPIALAVVSVLAGCLDSAQATLDEPKVQRALLELMSQSADGAVPSGCSFDPTGDSPTSVEGTWATGACTFTHTQLGSLDGVTCGVQIEFFDQHGGTIRQRNVSDVDTGGGGGFVTGPIPELPVDNVTIWQTNHAEGGAADCVSDNVNIIHLEGGPTAWSFCLLTVVLNHNGGADCLEDDWAVAVGDFSAAAARESSPRGSTPVASFAR